MNKRRERPQVSLLVPFRADPSSFHRERVWLWLREYWEHELPNAEIVVGHSRGKVFSKTEAVNNAARRARGRIFVILDADTYISGSVIRYCANEIEKANRKGRKLWFVPYRKLFRLTEESTERVLASDPARPVLFHSPPYPNEVESTLGSMHGHHFGALIQILPREAFICMDTRFNKGWGGEDVCADIATEILTLNGWKSYQAVKIGDTALTLNHVTGMSEWQLIQDVTIIPGEHKMLSVESRTHSSLTTMHHRWPVILRNGQRIWRESKDLNSHDRVPIAAECADLPSEPKFSDALVELVAWFWTEGHIRRRDVVIVQSHNVHADNCQRIEAALLAEFGPPMKNPNLGRMLGSWASWPTELDDSKEFRIFQRPIQKIVRWHKSTSEQDTDYFCLNAEAGGLIQSLAPGRVPSREFLLSLTQDQLELFILVSMLGDGSRSKQELEQKDPAAVESFAFALILSGRGVSISTRKQFAQRTKYEYKMSKVRMRQSGVVSLIPVPRTTPRGVDGKAEIVSYEGDVWCPTTANGSWLARRNGKVYFTGNSHLRAVDTLFAKHKSTPNDVLTLWHPAVGVNHKDRMWPGQTSPRANEQLASRYNRATGDREKMRRLVDEGCRSVKKPWWRRLFAWLKLWWSW